MVLRVEKDLHGVPYIQLGEHRMRLDLEDLDEEYRERAKNELGEGPEVVEEALTKIKEYVSDDKCLQVPLDDDFLLQFLRPLKFNPQNAFKVLRKFYKFRAKHPKYCANITPDAIRNVFDNEVVMYLPTRTPTGARLMVLNVGKNWNPKLVSIQDIFKAVMSALEIAMMEPKTHVGGVHVIVNMEGFGLTHISQLSPNLARMIMEWVQECAPVRLHGIHMVNQAFFFNMGYAIFKPFIGEQLRKKIFFHGEDRRSLCEKLSAGALPKSLGGTESLDYPGCLMSEMLYHYEDIFQKRSTYRYVLEK